MEHSKQNEQEVHTELEVCWKKTRKAGVAEEQGTRRRVEADQSLEGEGRKSTRSCRL